MEPRDPVEPAEVDEDREEEEEEGGDRQLEVEGPLSGEEVTGSEEEGTDAREVGSRLPETVVSDPSRRSYRLHRGFGDAGPSHVRASLSRDERSDRPQLRAFRSLSLSLITVNLL